ncbi:MAG: DUF1444 domain-containing protein [Flavobacterium psychrophilum]|nr:MAG: DUF1444 domain-containing protein [Flavobacterium psychrophilum]
MFFKKKKLSETEFANKFALALKNEFPEVEITSINKLEITSSLNSDPYTHFLDNAYSEYLRDTKDLSAIITKYVLSTSDIYLPKQPVNPEKIFPVIKDIRFLNELDRLPGDIRSKHFYETYNSELFIMYVEDAEHTVNYISKEDIEEANISLDQLRTLAIENFKNQISIEKHGDNGYYMLVAGGTYESSLILLNIWDHENFPVKGNIVIGIPSRDLLLITGSQDSKGLHKLYDIVEDISKRGDHLVSDKLFEYKTGKFELLDIQP